MPTEDLAKLLECVTESVYIENLRGDVTSVFSNINCVVLAIDKMSLSPVDTQTLVGAMDSRVEEVNLYEGVTMDLEILTEYDGAGKCGLLRTWNIKCNYTYWLEDENENQEDGFEDYEKVEKWKGKMENDWGLFWLSSIANYIEIIRDYEDPSDIYGEAEESSEVGLTEEEDGLNSDNEVEEIDFGSNVVNVVNETTEEHIPDNHYLA